MTRKLFAAALFAVACAATMCASSTASVADEAPPPRAVGEDDKKADAKGKFGGFKGKIDPEKLKLLKEKFGGKIDPDKLKELKEKIKNGDIDPEKLKKIKEKFGKGGEG